MADSQIQQLIRALFGERAIAYRPMIAKITGSVTACVLLSQFLFWCDKGKRKDGWFWKSQREITDETGLSRCETTTARKKLVALGLISERLQGVPATMHYYVHLDRMAKLVSQFVENLQTSLQDSDELV